MDFFTKIRNLLLSENWDSSTDFMTFVKSDMKIEFDTSNCFIFYRNDLRIEEVFIYSIEEMMEYINQKDNVT